MKQLNLTAGGYDAVIQTHWEGFNVQDYTFRINSMEQIVIEEIKNLIMECRFAPFI